MAEKLSLREAIRTGQLHTFVVQEESRGVGSVDKAELMEALEAAIKQPQLEDQTSRSASRGDSAEK